MSSAKLALSRREAFVVRIAASNRQSTDTDVELDEASAISAETT